MSIRKGDTVIAGTAIKLKPDWVHKIDLTANQLRDGYACLYDGQIFLSGHPGVENQRCYITVNSVKVASGMAGAAVGYRECQVQMTVKKGDVVRTITENGTGTAWTYHCTPIFVPWE